MKQRSIHVLIAYHDRAECQRLHHILSQQQDLTLLDPAQTVPDLVDRLTTAQPQVVFLDTHFTQGNGFGLMAHIRTLSPVTRVPILSESYMEDQEINAARVGALGYVHHNMAPAMLRKSVRATNAGEVWVRRKTVSRILDDYVRLAAIH